MCFIKIRFYPYLFTHMLSIFSIFIKSHSELLSFYNLVLIFISHNITQNYPLVQSLSTIIIRENLYMTIIRVSLPKCPPKCGVPELQRSLWTRVLASIYSYFLSG
jgi:hypothetical protein